MSRRSRYVRDPKALPMRLVPRDHAILHSVATLRLARSWHIHALHFEGRTLKVCQVRLQKLWHNGFLDRLFQPLVLIEGRGKPQSATPIYQLGPKGQRVLRDGGRLASRGKPTPSPSYLPHRLLVIDAHVAITCASAQDPSQTPAKWLSEGKVRTRLSRTLAPEHLVVPDAAFTLAKAGYGPSTFLLEVDTGLEPLVRTGEGSDIASKLMRYGEAHRSGRLAKAMGTKAVRVVFLTGPVQRADHILSLVSRLRLPPRLVLVGTLDGVVPGVPPGPTLRPSKVLLPLFQCAACPSWHSLRDPPM